MHFKNDADMMMMMVVVVVFAILRPLIFLNFIKGQGNPEVSDMSSFIWSIATIIMLRGLFCYCYALSECFHATGCSAFSHRTVDMGPLTRECQPVLSFSYVVCLPLFKKLSLLLNLVNKKI